MHNSMKKQEFMTLKVVNEIKNKRNNEEKLR